MIDSPTLSHDLDALRLDNSFAALPPAFYTRLAAQPLTEPRLLHANEQAGALIGDLTAAGIKVEPITTVNEGQATAAFIKGVEDKRIAHVGQAELDAAVANAATKITPSQTEVWDPRDATVDISPVVAASTAAFKWAATTKTPPPPPRRAAGSRARRGSEVASAGF